MNSLKRNWDWFLLALIVAGFVTVAAQRLGTVPVPSGDEAYMSEVAYEMQYHGKIAVPLMRYLGGNIENAWHCRTPVYFLMMAGFHKLFGYGLAEGRAFNLVTAIATLILVYLIGRKMFDWRAGMVAVVMLVADQTFLERSRLLRNDYAGAAFALLAFYLYEVAVRRKNLKYYAASGLAAGAGVMSHNNALYMLGAIVLLIVMVDGVKSLVSRKLYVFLGSAIVVMAYQIIYDIVDYKNFLLQNHGDKLHFQVLNRWGWWENLLREQVRYEKWMNGGVMFLNVPRTLLHLFQLLTVIAIVYLIVLCSRGIWRGIARADLRVHILLATVVVIVFHAVLSGNKDIYYIAHLAPWFALCVGVMVRDGIAGLGRLRQSSRSWAKPAYVCALVLLTMCCTGYGYEFAKENRRYLREVRNPELASFEEIKDALLSVVPEKLCPVAFKMPNMWLAFPDTESCFATIEPRMMDALDIDGNDYALILHRKHVATWPVNLDERYHLIGELRETAYSDLLIYYTGADPQLRAAAPLRYYFFDGWRGHVTEPQIAAASEVWSSSPDERLSLQKPAEIGPINLEANTAYQLRLSVESQSECELVIIDNGTGRSLAQMEIGGHAAELQIAHVFRTFAGRVTVVIRALNAEAGHATVSGLSVQRIAGL